MGEDFKSDDDLAADISKGMTGKVLRIDGQGDAFIKFFLDEFDDDGTRHWVHRTTFWEKLELSGKPERLRAAKVVDCLDGCSKAQGCNMQSMTKKDQKKFQKCMKDCKLPQCQQDEKCNPLFQGYAMCKEKVAKSGVCNPVRADAIADDAETAGREEQVEL